MTSLKLRVLDQSPVHDEGPESSGYASPCPEMMVSNVAHALIQTTTEFLQNAGPTVRALTNNQENT